MYAHSSVSLLNRLSEAIGRGLLYGFTYQPPIVIWVTVGLCLALLITELITDTPLISIYLRTMQSAVSLSTSSVNAVISPLSSREAEVLRLIVEGNTNIQIAAHLYVSPNTVKTHVRSILNKLGVGDRVQAAVFALRNNLV